MQPSSKKRQAELAWIPPDGELRCQAATVVGLDEQTVRLNIGEELPLFQQCRIALLDEAGERRLVADATVHYLRGIRGEKRLSCRWAAPLSRQELELLTAAGLYERRVECRAPITLDVPAWPELTGTPGVIPVRIVDLSSGGCCLKSPAAVPVGQRLMIRVWSERSPVATVRMRVRWEQVLGDDVLLGCAFTQRSGYATLSSIVEQEYHSTKAGISLTGRSLAAR